MFTYSIFWNTGSPLAGTNIIQDINPFLSCPGLTALRVSHLQAHLVAWAGMSLQRLAPAATSALRYPKSAPEKWKNPGLLLPDVGFVLLLKELWWRTLDTTGCGDLLYLECRFKEFQAREVFKIQAAFWFWRWYYTISAAYPSQKLRLKQGSSLLLRLHLLFLLAQWKS